MSPPQAIYLDEKSDQQTLLPIHSEIEPAPPVPDRSKCRRKKLRILTSILLIWLGFKLFSYCVRYQSRQHYRPELMKTSRVSSMIWRIPPDITIEDCAEWQGDYQPGWRRFAFYEPFTSSASFALPIASEKLFLLSRGMAAGSVKVRYGSDSNDVQIQVLAHYRLPEALESVQVCTVTRGEGKNGLGIFDSVWSRSNNVRFEVTLYLPKASQGSVLDVKDFETDMPLFSHHIGELENDVHFKSIKLRSANTPIVVGSLRAENAIMKTCNSPIDGNFKVSSSLKLMTANAHINVNVNLYNDEEKAITNLQMKTSNAAIRGTLQLESAQGTGGKFQVSASTANAPLKLVVSEAPVSSTLLLDANTALAPATVQLHKTYEGTFDVASSLKRPTVSWEGPDPEDPAGKGRKRMVELTTRGTTVAGSVRWSDIGEEMPGRVKVETSLAPLTLKF